MRGVAEFLAMLNRTESTFRWVLVLMGLTFALGFLNQLFELLTHLRGLFG